MGKHSNLFMSSFNDLHFAAWERTAIRECCRYIEWVQYITLFDIRHQNSENTLSFLRLEDLCLVFPKQRSKIQRTA